MALVVGRIMGLWSDTAVLLETLHVGFMSGVHGLRHTRIHGITVICLGANLWSGHLDTEIQK